VAAVNGVDGHETDIVAVAGIFAAGIAETRDDQHGPIHSLKSDARFTTAKRA
jgi:hypothetical protein